MHLRGGKVARGGIRWSDRREDFRTEVLGLMKAQMVKNAVIVPVGAKGGFVVKRPPRRAARRCGEEVVGCYRTFIRGLLDLTDNIVGGEIVPPADVVRYDDDDPYLVVAADKGTATFSDIANEIAARVRLLARRRLRLRRLGRLRPQGDGHHRARRVGVGHAPLPRAGRRRRSRAGLHRRRHRRHVRRRVRQRDAALAATSAWSAPSTTAHIFLDPDPDPAASFDGARAPVRAAALVVGGLRPRPASPRAAASSRARAKSIPLSPEARAALGRRRQESLTPNELIRAILRAPVDLLWNGGIGTYVKASTETHADVGDKANDAVRVDATSCAAGWSARAATSG